MDGTSFLLVAPVGKKITTLAARRSLIQFGKIASCSFTRDGHIAALFEEKVVGVPESLPVDGILVKISVVNPRMAKGTIFSMELAGCSKDEVALELEGQVTEVKALPSRTAQSNSGRFLLTFPKAVPEVVRLSCGLQHVPMSLRCRSCFVYGHHEKDCEIKQLCEKCNAPEHKGTCSKPPLCAACGGGHPVTSLDCPTWKKEIAIRRIRTEEGISHAAAVHKLSQSRFNIL